jgi:hypothetical protein
MLKIRGYLCRVDSQSAALIFRVVQEEGRSLGHNATLKGEAARSFEAPGTIYQTKRRHVPQDLNLQYERY